MEGDRQDEGGGKEAEKINEKRMKMEAESLNWVMRG